MAIENKTTGDCCGGFTSNTVEAVQTPNPIELPLDNCGDKASYLALVGEEFKRGMPVKFGSDPRTVEPAVDGKDAIGICLGNTLAVEGDAVVVQRTGHFRWSDISPAITDDESVGEEADWWAVHTELAKANLYVGFV